MNTQKFPLGNIVITPGIFALIKQDAGVVHHLGQLLTRHQAGDWGELDDEDKRENDLSVTDGFRILSSYRVLNAKVWVITESDRSYTTILLPSEY